MILIDSLVYVNTFHSTLNQMRMLNQQQTIDGVNHNGGSVMGRALTGVLSFGGVFGGSCAIGVLSALFMALVLKHTRLHRYPIIYNCLNLLFECSRGDFVYD